MHEVTSMFVALFEGMDDEYMSARASDIKDVTNRILAHLLGYIFQIQAILTNR